MLVRNLLHALIGVISGAMVIIIYQGLIASLLFPRPEGFDTKDPQQILDFMASAPTQLFQLLCVGQFLAAGITGWLTTRLNQCQHPALVLAPALALIMLSVINSLTFHTMPTWFKWARIFIMLPGFWIGMKVACKFIRKS